MPIEALQIPDRTWEALVKLASITGVSEQDSIPKLIQDALRVYEWVLRQQAQKRTIVALEENDLNNPSLEVKRESLNRLYPDDKKFEEAQEYFREAS
jgi:hypothetical protein